jgi:hypothetical protein
MKTFKQWLSKRNTNASFGIPSSSVMSLAQFVKDVAECVMDKIGIRKPIKWLGEETIWKGDNRRISTASSIVDRVPLLYNTSYKAIYNAVEL